MAAERHRELEQTALCRWREFDVDWDDADVEDVMVALVGGVGEREEEQQVAPGVVATPLATLAALTP